MRGVESKGIEPSDTSNLRSQATKPSVVVVMPAYNAAQTLERTYEDIPRDIVDNIILVDDVSQDETVEIAKHLGLFVVVHPQNRGYGGNQKTCYDRALEIGADVVVMLHPDYQYDATRIPALIQPILDGRADLVLGSRFLGDPLAGGMPRWKYVSNRFLTAVENVAFGLRLSEFHTGFRAYSRQLLHTLPYHRNSNDFVFDQELIGQAVRARFRITEIGVPTRYFAEASSVGFRRSVVYGFSTLRVVAQHLVLSALGRRAAPRNARPAKAFPVGIEPESPTPLAALPLPPLEPAQTDSRPQGSAARPRPRAQPAAGSLRAAGGRDPAPLPERHQGHGP